MTQDLGKSLKNLPDMIKAVKQHDEFLRKGGWPAYIKALKTLTAWANSGGETEQLEVRENEAGPSAPAPAPIGGQTDRPEARPGKNTDKATIASLNKRLESWMKAPAWMVKASISVALAGPKARKREELWGFVQRAGGPAKERSYNAQFEAWRKALPPDYYDKCERAKKPQIDVESLEG